MSRPYLSVIIPAYNEADFLPACLESLREQVGAPRYEVIVVDNDSSDATAAVAGSFGAYVAHQLRRGVCAARQTGLEAARGEIVVSADADCQYPPDWLARVARTFQDQPDVVLRLGNYRFPSEVVWLNRLLAAWESLALRLHYGWGWQWYVSAANLAFRRGSFDGYDISLTQAGDELYVIDRLRAKGRVVYDFKRPVITSDRRLRSGFGRVFFKDFLAGYLMNYWRIRRGRPSRQAYADHRQLVTKGLDASTVILLATFLLVVSAALWAVGLIVAGSGHPLLTSSGLAGLGSLVAAYGLFAPRSQLLSPQLTAVRTDQKLIALTFDDGPNGSFSLAVARIIESYGGRASFFQVGRCIERWPEITKRLAAAGHVIGNHSWRHAFQDYLRPGQLLRHIERTSQLITDTTGQPPRFFRSPWLFRTPLLYRTVRRLGMEPVAGVFAQLGEARQPPAQVMADAAYKKCRPGAIMIFHDGYNASGADRRQTVEAVRLLCARLHQEGYHFVGLDAFA